ncbi:radical SAM protein [Candidatus Neomarinimicrobiota bacterium]
MANITKFDLPDGSTVILTLKRHAFNVFHKPQNDLWTFDLEGRLIGMFVDQQNYRRTMENHFFRKTRSDNNDLLFRGVENIYRDEVDPILSKVRALLTDIEDKIPESFKDIISKIFRMNWATLVNDANQFSKIYLPIAILPPDQYMSLVIQLTEGCNYNKCTFCNFYRDRPFRIKTHDELKKHVSQIKSLFGNGILLKKSIFLADANALVTPQSRLLPAIKHIRNIFPEIPGIYSFIDVFTGLRKTKNDFTQLAINGLKRVYLGVESGNQDLLKLLNKSQSNNAIIALTQLLKSSGISVGIIFLAGAGGIPYAKNHAEDSISLIQQLHLSKDDIIYISEFYQTNEIYDNSLKQLNIAIPPRKKINELATKLKNEIKKVAPKDVSVSIYDINQFFY